MPRTILLVHTNEALGRFLTVLLEQDGYGIVPAASVKEALRTVQAAAPSVVIIEDGCPEISTVDLVQRLQRGEEGKRLPIIVISADPAMEYELQQVFDFLLKPVDVNRLRQDLALLSRGGRKRLTPAPLGHLTEDESRLYCDYLLTNSGLHFERRNQKILERGITSRMAALHSASYRDYFDYLAEYGESRQELQKLLQHLTVGETFFFRYRAHFDALRQLVSGEMADKPLRIWSAGCSTGEEPYSLAMTIMEALPDWRKRDISILATDINNRSLQRAREGVYRPWSLRATEPRHLERYFTRVGDSYLVRDEVKQLVEFSHLNLQTAAFPQPDGPLRELDVIFCRNVTIYFTLATTRQIVDKFAATLAPGGYLFLGHAEALTHISTRFERVSRESGFYYRKKSPSATAAVPELKSPRPRPVKKAVEPPRPAKLLHPSKMPPPIPPPAPVPTPEELYRQARELFDGENFKEAEALLGEILRQRPDHLDALVMKGFIHANRAQFRDALALCDQVLARNDLHPDAYFLRGLVLEIEEQLPDALVEYRKALLLSMDFVMPHYCMGRLYFRMGKARDGMREFRNCLRLLEQSPEGNVVPYGGGLSREVFMERVRTELARVA